MANKYVTYSNGASFKEGQPLKTCMDVAQFSNTATCTGDILIYSASADLIGFRKVCPGMVSPDGLDTIGQLFQTRTSRRKAMVVQP